MNSLIHPYWKARL